MDSTVLTLVLIVLVAVAGCMESKAPAESASPQVTSAPSTVAQVSSGPEPAIGDATVPFIQENDTVEIGEML